MNAHSIEAGLVLEEGGSRMAAKDRRRDGSSAPDEMLTLAKRCDLFEHITGDEPRLRRLWLRLVLRHN